MKQVFVVIAVVLIVASCAKLDRGTVISKQYEPERWYTIVSPITISNGTTTSTVMVPYRVHDDADWYLVVVGMHNGEDHVERWRVTQEIYEHTSLNATVDRQFVTFSREDNTRERVSE